MMATAAVRSERSATSISNYGEAVECVVGTTNAFATIVAASKLTALRGRASSIQYELIDSRRTSEDSRRQQTQQQEQQTATIGNGSGLLTQLRRVSCSNCIMEMLNYGVQKNQVDANHAAILASTSSASFLTSYNAIDEETNNMMSLLAYKNNSNLYYSSPVSCKKIVPNQNVVRAKNSEAISSLSVLSSSELTSTSLSLSSSSLLSIQQHDSSINNDNNNTSRQLDQTKQLLNNNKRSCYSNASNSYHHHSRRYVQRNDSHPTILHGSTAKRMLAGLYLASQLLVALGILLFAAPSANAKKFNEVTVDWTLESDLFNKGDWITTKYVRMKDVLSIRCAPIISFKIYMVPKESALFCKSPAADVVDGDGRRMRQTIGTCAPNSSNPTVKVRSTALAHAPVFRPGHSYFLITTSTGTSEGIENTEGGLCQTQGMRLRLVVMDEADDGDQLPADKLINFSEIFPNLRAPISRTQRVRFEEEGNYVSQSNSRKSETGVQNRQIPSRIPINESWSERRDRLFGSAAKNKEESVRYTNGGQNDASDQSGHRGDRSQPPSQSINAIGRSSTLEAKSPAASSSSSDGFPAILAVEENGRIKTILVHNARQLQEEINHASERNNRVQQIREYNTNIRHLPEYSMTGHGKINALPITINNNGRDRTRHVANNGDEESREGAWSRNAPNWARRNTARNSYTNPNEAANASPEVEHSHAYSSSLKSSASATQGNEHKMGDSTGGKHLPFTYVVGYNSADATYTGEDVTDEDEMLLDVPTSSSTTTSVNGLLCLPYTLLCCALLFLLMKRATFL